jgi:CubicO group peptidase (beta-lactamase class C family)
MGLLPDLQTRLRETAARHDVPGAAIAVGHGDELAEAATGVVNRNTGVATTPDSLFQVGSATKVWTATLVMQLVDEGLVDLDQPVRRYLPEFAVADEEVTRAVTVRQLLAHTGGFVGDLFEDTGRGDEALDRYVAHLRGAATRIHPPGALFSYCNAGYSVLGALVARLRGGTWEAALREHVAEPLGATHVALFADEAILFRASAGHIKPPATGLGSNAKPAGQTGRDAAEPIVVPRWQLPRSLGPAGAVLCAAPRELVRAGRMLCAGGVAEGGKRILSAHAVSAMRTAQVMLPGIRGPFEARWGLGLAQFDWNGTQVVGHDGDTPGQATVWRILPDHGLVIVLSVNGGAVSGLVDELVVPLVTELTGVAVPPPLEPPAVPVPVAMDGYAGRYAAPLAVYDVTVVDGALDITATPQGLAAQFGMTRRTDRYVPLAGETFIATEPEDGRYARVCFVDGGRYLHNGRAVPRVTG